MASARRPFRALTCCDPSAEANRTDRCRRPPSPWRHSIAEASCSASRAYAGLSLSAVDSTGDWTTWPTLLGEPVDEYPTFSGDGGDGFANPITREFDNGTLTFDIGTCTVYITLNP